MKKTLLVLAGILIISCNQSKKENPKANTKSNTSAEISENFDWLLGKWKRLNEKEGKETLENWEKVSNTEYAGLGFTMQNGDTINQENMWLVQTNGKWDLTVKVPEESESVSFKGTDHNESEFICENHEIEFPNKIKYWINGERLNATVSNSEMEIPFEFEKLD